MIDIVEKNVHDRYMENIQYIFESEARDIESFARITDKIQNKTKL